MRGITHALGGAVVGLVITTNWLGAATGALGALLPDVDHPNSLAGRRAGVVGGAVRLFVGHRGLMHSGLIGIALVWAASLVPSPYRQYAVATALGYASHLMLDALTVQGIPLFWPSRRRVSFLPLRTGGVGEMAVRLGLIGLMVAVGLGVV